MVGGSPGRGRSRRASAGSATPTQRQHRPREDDHAGRGVRSDDDQHERDGGPPEEGARRGGHGPLADLRRHGQFLPDHRTNHAWGRSLDRVGRPWIMPPPSSTRTRSSPPSPRRPTRTRRCPPARVGRSSSCSGTSAAATGGRPRSCAPACPPTRGRWPTGEPPEGGLVDWLRGGPQAILDAVAEVGPDTPVWTFTGPRPASWWIRRREHEVLVHRADAALALGPDFVVRRRARGRRRVRVPRPVGGADARARRHRRSPTAPRCTCTPPTTARARRGSGSSAAPVEASRGSTGTPRATSPSVDPAPTSCSR